MMIDNNDIYNTAFHPGREWGHIAPRHAPQGLHAIAVGQSSHGFSLQSDLGQAVEDKCDNRVNEPLKKSYKNGQQRVHLEASGLIWYVCVS